MLKFCLHFLSLHKKVQLFQAAPCMDSFFDQAFFNQPPDLIVDCFLVGASGVVQLALCLGIVKNIVSSQIVDGEGSHQRLLAGHLSLFLQHLGKHVGQTQRQIYADLLGAALLV